VYPRKAVCRLLVVLLSHNAIISLNETGTFSSLHRKAKQKQKTTTFLERIQNYTETLESFTYNWYIDSITRRRVWIAVFVD